MALPFNYRIRSCHLGVLCGVVIASDIPAPALPTLNHSMTNPNDPVSPLRFIDSEYAERGLSKRELFAAMAMQGLLSNAVALELFNNVYGSEHVKRVAEASASWADALIAALNETEAK